MRAGLGINFKEEMADHAITALMNHANSRTSSDLEPKSTVAERRVAQDNTFSPASRISEANSEAGRLNLADEDLSSGKISQADTRKIIAPIREEVTKLLLEKPGDNDWQVQLGRAFRLHVGEWVEFSVLPEHNQISMVAWANEGHGAYVFVNQRGVKTSELMVEELASMLFEHRVNILDESVIPLTDRASHRMLQNMHNQLTYQAIHDELTGLINRKEFERVLSRALISAKKRNIGHIVACLDLDQFKVINNAAGYTAGDRLIKELGSLLSVRLEGSQFVLSRLGGDEFGVLIEDCKKESGLIVIRELCDAIKRFQFKWENDSFKLTASCGVVYLNIDTESVSSILLSADSACYAAKDAGRDRLHVYEAGDSEMEHRTDVMNFVS